jgi:hypothetical protein
MTESQLQVRWARVNGEFWVAWGIPGSDRDISFNGRTGPNLETQIEMVEELIAILRNDDGFDDGWDVELIDGKWFATDQGRWNRFEWVDGSWTHAECRDNLDEAGE